MDLSHSSNELNLPLSCPVCNGIPGGRASHLSWNFENKIFRLVTCVSCQSTFTWPLPSDAILKQVYSTFPYNWYQEHLYWKLKDAEERYVEYQPFLGNSILDFGGGVGYFSEICKRNGKISSVFDPFIGAQLDSKDLWDSLVAFHVLEHSNNVASLLGQIERLLKKDAVAIFSVPNAESKGYKKWLMNFTWAQPPFIHPLHFTQCGLSTLLTNNAFKIVQIIKKDRWDANYLADVVLKNKSLKMDLDWGHNLDNDAKRAEVVKRNGAYRNRMLAYSRLIPFATNDSELTIIAKKM